DEVEAQLEAELAALGVQGDPRPRPGGAEVGDLRSATAAVARYVDHLTGDVVEPGALEGLRVVLDGAHGAAAGLAASVYEAVGAQVVAIHTEPDGTNINDGAGSTHPEALQAAVAAHGADLGLAFDGDADRVLAVDAAGELIDGDQIIAVCAIDLHERGTLAHDTVVVTVMSNLGFRQGMAARGIEVVTTDVGDRYVLDAMAAGGFVLGGEQSGHVVFREHASTGDGMLTGLVLAGVVARTGRTLRELADAAMVRLPQVLTNVRTARRDPDLVARLAPKVAEAEASLGDRGRVLLRASGTEPLIRVMVEAPTHDEAAAVAAGLAAAVGEAAS
ncbi:MAG: phosphoglucosamine mutase, partial [Acidimicrobiales bacterium]|nr:phosphoglucosamine mutase [Acidimicrobiales bacterium]